MHPRWCKISAINSSALFAAARRPIGTTGCQAAVAVVLCRGGDERRGVFPLMKGVWFTGRGWVVTKSPRELLLLPNRGDHENIIQKNRDYET